MYVKAFGECCVDIHILAFADPDNGCELPVLGPQAQVSGRGSAYHLADPIRIHHFPFAFAAASPVRSSELLCGPIIETHHLAGRSAAIPQPDPKHELLGRHSPAFQEP